MVKSIDVLPQFTMLKHAIGVFYVLGHLHTKHADFRNIFTCCQRVPFGKLKEHVGMMFF